MRWHVLVCCVYSKWNVPRSYRLATVDIFALYPLQIDEKSITQRAILFKLIRKVRHAHTYTVSAKYKRNTHSHANIAQFVGQPQHPTWRIIIFSDVLNEWALAPYTPQKREMIWQLKDDFMRCLTARDASRLPHRLCSTYCNIHNVLLQTLLCRYKRTHISKQILFSLLYS